MRPALSRSVWILLATAWLASVPAVGQVRGSAIQVDLPADSLARALIRLAKTTGIELLFDPRTLATKRTLAIHGRFTTEQVLDRLLADSGFTARRIGPNRYILAALPKPPPQAVAETAVPDILVIGSRSLNLDIPRSKDDIQPYRVITGADARRSPGQSVDDVLRSRLPSNVQALSARQASSLQLGSARSEADLRGLGPLHTLILVDGRRLPSVAATNDFLQPDLNALPLSAIDRIEILGGTAGGIYGPGATGGVLNVILRHDYPRLWLHAISGISARGDGARRGLEGGFAFQNDRTQIDVIFGRTEDDGLRFGERTFVEKARSLRVSRGIGTLPPTADAVNIRTLSGPSLTLLPEFGGGSLGTSIATYPVNGGGAGADEGALLRGGAGRYMLPLPSDGSGTLQSLLTPYRTVSLLASIRQQIGGKVEAFGDVLVLGDKGYATGPAVNTRQILLSPGQSGNPFINDILVSYATPSLSAITTTSNLTVRATGGIIVHLNRSWSIEGEVSWAESRVLERSPNLVSLTGVDVFAPGSGLTDALVAYTPSIERLARRTNRLRDFSLRIAGPLATLPGGPLSLTWSAEDRLERNPGESTLGADGRYKPVFVNGLQRVAVTSAFGEVRAPLVADTSSFLPLRGFELQLAARVDRYQINEPNQLAFGGTTATSGVGARYTTFSYTVGTKVTPTDGVLLRASYAVASLPGSLAARQILPLPISLPLQPYLDPKRIGESLLATGPVLIVLGGSPSLPAERVRTFTTGIVIRPAILRDVRFSIDYAHIVKSREANLLLRLDGSYFLANERLFPGRIVREPITASDIANGYTGGVVTRIDATAPGIGTTSLDAIDFDAQFERTTRWGRLSFKAGISWEPNFRRRGQPSAAFEQLAGYHDGPIEWKGNASVAWQKGPLGVVIDGQFFDRYRIAEGSTALTGGADTPDRIAQQGSPYVAAQAYIDMAIRYSPERSNPVGRLTYRLGVQNLFDRLPPLVVPAINGGTDGIGYSPYGDPRGRRFELSVTADF